MIKRQISNRTVRGSQDQERECREEAGKWGAVMLQGGQAVLTERLGKKKSLSKGREEPGGCWGTAFQAGGTAGAKA